MIFGIYDNWADVIFNKLYDAYVPIISTYSEDELDIVGVPLNIIDDERHNSFNEKVLVKITIVDMIEKFNKGFAVSVAKQSDVEQIYDVIQKHLIAWRDYGVKSLNQASLPRDDLILMDKFANEIFNINKRTIIQKDISKPKSFSNDFRSLMMSEIVVNKTEPEIEYDEIERQSIAPKKIRESKYDLNSLLM